MKIFIISTEDPIKINAFLKKVIVKKKQKVVGLAIVKGSRLTVAKQKSKLKYIISLFLIMGWFSFLKNSIIHVFFKLQKRIARIFPFVKDNSLAAFAAKNGINVTFIQTPNSKKFIEHLKTLNIDVIINQSQSILKKELLSVPAIGTLNRHNALLPKNRGRITPFWVLYKGEKETGVSIHLVEESLDSGEIIVQERYPVSSKDTFNTLVDKNYQIAPGAMIKALDMLENGVREFIPNNDSEATYNTTPTLKEAWEYRKKRMFG